MLVRSRCTPVRQFVRPYPPLLVRLIATRVSMELVSCIMSLMVTRLQDKPRKPRDLHNRMGKAAGA